MEVMTITTQKIRSFLQEQPRVPAALLPTPLHEAKRLTQLLGGPRIFLKRDDLTGFAYGGNKTRNLEFRLAHAVTERVDVLLMALEITSNSARQTVAAANKLGMRTVLVLKGERPAIIQGNLLLNYLLGAEVHFARDAKEQQSIVEDVFEQLRQAGKKPLVLTSEPIFDIGSALAYFECTLELLEQMQNLGAYPDYLYMTSGGKGQAGLVLAKKFLDAPYKVHGVTVSYEYDVQPRTAKIANAAAQHLGLDTRIFPEEVVSFSDFVGPGYGVPTEEAYEAMKLMAQTEGVILDPIYTGKCFAALHHHITQGVIEPDATVVFIHTGGSPAIFAHADEILAHVSPIPAVQQEIV